MMQMTASLIRIMRLLQLGHLCLKDVQAIAVLDNVRINDHPLMHEVYNPELLVHRHVKQTASGDQDSLC